MSLPIKAFYVQNGAKSDTRPFSEPKNKIKVAVPYNQYISKREPQAAIEKLKQKISET